MTHFDLHRFFFSQYADQYERWHNLLSPDERERAKRLKFDDVRQRFVIGRGLLRTHLASFMQVQPQDVHFVYSEHGKPYVQHETRLQFSVAHSADLLLIATAINQLIGIDVEYLRPMPQMHSLAETYFTAQEQQQLQTMTGETQISYFFRCWTAKEAYVKASGEGFRSGAFTEIAVPWNATNPYHLQHLDGTAMNDHLLETFMPTEGYIATVCITD